MKAIIFLLGASIILSLKVIAQTESVNFSADVTSGYGHVTVTFTNTSKGSFQYFIWSAYDNTQTISNLQSYVYTFKRPGIYEVTLMGKSTSGPTYVETKYKYITVYETKLPAYELTANEVTINANGYITSCNVSDFNTTTYNCGHIKIPTTINGQIVKGIADDNTGVFYDKGIIKLNLTNSLEYIGQNAFLNNYIQGVVIPNGVKNIGRAAFGNNDMRSVKIPPSVERIEDYAFHQQHVIGNASMNGVGSTGSFNAMTRVTFMDENGAADIKQSKLKYIGKAAFGYAGTRGGNKGLIEGDHLVGEAEGMFIPPSVEEIDSHAFWDHSIKNLAFTDGSPACSESKLRFLREGAFMQGVYTKISSTVVIPASIEIIEKNALYMVVGPNGKIEFENNSLLYFVDEMAYGGTYNIGPVKLPSLKAANNTYGLWINKKTGDYIQPESDGSYSLSFNDKRILKAAYIVDFVDYDGTPLKTDTILHGNVVIAPVNPSRTGYTFSGWDHPLDSVVSYLTITAQYTQNTNNAYTIIFKDWDGTIISSQTIVKGSVATAPAAPARTGYVFTGWDTDFSNITSDLTITAQYTINSFTVTFNDWDGIQLNQQTVNYGSAATAPIAPIRSGYAFTGWDADFSNVTSNLTVKAQYSIQQFTVTFIDFDASELKTETIDYGNDAIAPADPVRTGYTFAGWDTDFSNVMCDLTVTAQYSMITNVRESENNNFVIYPNPVINGVVYIKANRPVGELFLFDLLGNQVYKDFSNKTIFSIHVNGLPKGVYVLKMDTFTGKVVIE